MEHLRHIQNFEQIKILADARRLEILRLLMAAPATLSQLGQILGEHPARVRHHLKQLEEANLVELVDTRVVRGFVEKYYRARARAFMLQDLILPDDPEREIIAVLGSHDLALEALAERLRQREHSQIDLLVLPVGSLDGLVALRQGSAQLAGCHLLDAESGEYNLPFVRHLFPDRQVSLLTLAHRQQGLILPPGNPREISGLQDLARPGLVWVNRNRGSGTRLWLDYQLGKLAIVPDDLQIYNREVRTHTAVAEAIQRGKADAGLGLQAAARQHDLDFIPLFEERFDLVISQESIENCHLQPLLDDLQSAGFRRLVESLGGYQTAHTGDQINI
ncbi:MAG: helix-turn-helix domain-containing protein [Anaerolineales bacterium]|nr:helix-turn-helix domain-containing protein [Anaerolineales bacterium]